MTGDIFFYHCWQVQDLLQCLEFDDFLPDEVEQLVTILGTAYGRKIASGPPPPGSPRPLKAVRSEDANPA